MGPVEASDIGELRRRFELDNRDLAALLALVTQLERAGQIEDAYLLCVDHTLIPDRRGHVIMELAKQRLAPVHWSALEDDFLSEMAPDLRERYAGLAALRRRLGDQLAERQDPILEALFALQDEHDFLHFGFRLESGLAYGREVLERRQPVLGLSHMSRSEALRDLASALPLLRRMIPSRVAAHDRVLALVPELTTLRSFSLPFMGEVSSAGLAALARSPSITDLTIHNVRLINGGIEGLASFATLRSLVLQSCSWFADRDWETLRALPQLRTLSTDLALTAEAFSRLVDCPLLEELVFTGACEAAGLDRLLRRGRLKSLTLPCRSLGGDLLAALVASTSLERLQLTDCSGLGLERLRPLRGCASLKELVMDRYELDRELLQRTLPALRCVVQERGPVPW